MSTTWQCTASSGSTTNRLLQLLPRQPLAAAGRDAPLVLGVLEPLVSRPARVAAISRHHELAVVRARIWPPVGRRYVERMSATKRRLVPLRELTPARFGEIGRPTCMGRTGDGRFVAIGSTFDRLFWRARILGPTNVLPHRVSLYSGDLKRRIAVFDGATFPINAVAFHPFQSWLAIGTGIYDGGYYFNGELWAWNWETGERRRLLGESREVAACRFDDEGRLEVLVRPPTDEEFDFTTYFRLVLNELSPTTEDRDGGDPRLNGLPQVDPATLGFRVSDNKLPELSAEELDTLRSAGYEQRHRVWDLAWLSDDRIAAVHDCCHLEIWSLASDRRELHLTGTGHGIELLHHSDGLLVHVLERGNWETTGKVDRSTLFTLRGGELVPRHSFDCAHTFSIDLHGRVWRATPTSCTTVDTGGKTWCSMPRVLRPSRPIWDHMTGDISASTAVRISIFCAKRRTLATARPSYALSTPTESFTSVSHGK
jgi:hypothetical protein